MRWLRHYYGWNYIILSKAKVAFLVSNEMNSGNFLGWPIVLRDTIGLPSPILFDVRLDVEIQKENEEHSTMEEDDIAVFFGKLTINENWKSCMDEKGGKLGQLHSCYISEIFTFILSLKLLYCLPFPPQILLYTGSKAWHEVVEIHEDMNTHVQEAHKSCVTSSNPS